MFTARVIPLAAALALSGAVLAAPPIASAKNGNGVRATGTCTQNSTSKLKLSGENGKVEVEFEVDQNRNAVPWKVTLRRNGALVSSTIATTRAPSGSFSARRVVAGPHGTYVAVAKRSGETCTVRATI
jgi:DUF4097 and DUF4098 domain-containing protein YvlB